MRSSIRAGDYRAPDALFKIMQSFPRGRTAMFQTQNPFESRRRRSQYDRDRGSMILLVAIVLLLLMAAGGILAV